MSRLLNFISTISVLLSAIVLSGYLIRYYLIVVPPYYYMLILLSYVLIHLILPLNCVLAIIAQNDSRISYYCIFAILIGFFAWLFSRIPVDFAVFQLV